MGAQCCIDAVRLATQTQLPPRRTCFIVGMHIRLRPVPPALLLLLGCASTPAPTAVQASAVRVPATGWSEERQAVHVLNRLAYGPSPASLSEVRAAGVEAWIELQLRPGEIDDRAVEAKLAPFRSLNMTTAQRLATYEPEAKLAKARGLDPADPETRARLAEELPMSALPRQMGAELVAAKLIRATESRRQLEEVLLDFWFNHFNVAAQKGAVRWMLASYEQEALRPHLFGSFRALLGAVAHHPAMLFYLDNWASTREGFDLAALRRSGVPVPDKLAQLGRLGLNENYARELLELHTLGVDGGYTQGDVREVARCFTGWGIDRPRQVGTFAFHPLAHDRGEKRVLGRTIAAGSGIEDGEQVLDLLAAHPSTAHFLARKLAQKFVADDPPPALVEHLAAVYLESNGDLTAVYRALFRSPEFWSDQAFAAKTKTPLEFTVSAVRALGGTTAGDVPLVRALDGMGEPLYRAQPPTGWPEVAAPWVNAGALVSRINFALALASGRVPGTEVVLPVLPGTATTDASVDAMAQAVLHRTLSPATRTTLLRAVAGDGDVMPDGEKRPLDPAKVAGLLLGSPEFQKQ
jgi:uncharacterized protein (DUF1800 family)